MKIFSPSYKRADGVKTHKIIPNVIYCVHEFEAKEYIDRGYTVEKIPDQLRGNIAVVRNYIKKELIGKEGLMIDDDIEALKIYTGYKGNPVQKSIENVPKFIEDGFQLCKEFGCTLWGLNIVGDKGSYREYSPFSLTNTISGSFMGFVNNNLEFDENLPLKEDYDFCIQVLNKHRKLLRLNFASMVKKDHGNLGGCADYRTRQREIEQMEMLEKKWGTKIIKRDKIKRGKKKVIHDINPIIKIPIKGI